MITISYIDEFLLVCLNLGMVASVQCFKLDLYSDIKTDSATNVILLPVIMHAVPFEYTIRIMIVNQILIIHPRYNNNLTIIPIFL